MREALRYVGNTAKEVVGIGEFQRKRNYHIKYFDPVFDYNEKPEIMVPILYGFGGFLLPSTLKPELGNNKLIPLFLLDMASLYIPVVMSESFGLHWEAAVTKLGYNTLVQIAPDVASLAKRKIFHRR